MKPLTGFLCKQGSVALLAIHCTFKNELPPLSIKPSASACKIRAPWCHTQFTPNNSPRSKVLSGALYRTKTWGCASCGRAHSTLLSANRKESTGDIEMDTRLPAQHKGPEYMDFPSAGDLRTLIRVQAPRALKRKKLL